MIDPTKLQCLTTASWLRGYAGTLGEFTHSALIHRMNQAADLLEKTWDEYAKENGYENTKREDEK
jgi:hypothetical protein